METEGQQYVRKHWIIIILYCVLASAAIGFSFAVVPFVLLTFYYRFPVLETSHIALWIGGVISAGMFIIQFVGEPFVLTRDIICRKCHKRIRLDREPLMRDKHYRVPNCECGGDFEPAYFWRLESHDHVV
jgi:hypothetical protein